MSSKRFVLALRLSGAVLASAVFGLVCALAFPDWSFWAAIGFAFVFGTGFMVGTGYRILIVVARRVMQPAPVSWSGATAGAALAAMGLGGMVVLSGGDVRFVWLAFGIAINLAYLPIKTACLQVGCCQATRPFALKDLRLTEIALSSIVVLSSVAMALGGAVQYAAVLAIGGHVTIRLFSRHLRGRWSWGWPPFTQPGAELLPLMVLFAAAALIGQQA